MKELSVGMYVRTKNGKIKKLLKYTIDENVDYINNHRLYFEGDDFGSLYKKEELPKASNNPIDLIEEHDILKIEEKKGVYTICEVEAFIEPYEEYTFLGVRIDNRPIARKLYELNIKSIVTKEQFQNIEYRFGD